MIVEVAVAVSGICGDCPALHAFAPINALHFQNATAIDCVKPPAPGPQ